MFCCVLVGGKELWKSMRVAFSLCLENMILILIFLAMFLQI